MDSLKVFAAKIKSSPQLIRKTFASSAYDSYAKVSSGDILKGKYHEDWLHAEDSLKEGIHFYAKMLGSCPVYQAQGVGCTDEAVQKIVGDTKKIMSTTPSGGSLQKVLLTVTTRKLTIEDMLSKEKIIEIPIYRVSCCATDPNFTKVLAFVSRAHEGHDLTCHALLCSNFSMAQAMALTIADAFKMAFINYERAKVDKCHDGSRLAQYDLNQQGEAVVNKGFVEADTNPKTTMEDPLNAPIIQVTEGTSSLATEENLIKKMQALDLAVDSDSFDTEFTKLAESRSNPILFETPVRKRDFTGDVNYLMATEATAKELTMSKSTEDLLS